MIRGADDAYSLTYDRRGWKVNTFFFKHPLASGPGRPPGRYPFEVTAPALVRGGAGLPFAIDEAWRGKVYLDGKAAQRPSSNMDPAALSDVLPGFLAFCRITALDFAKTPPKNAVHHLATCAHVRDHHVLADVAAPGDVVLFGNHLGLDFVFIDFVLFIGEIVELPMRNGKITLSPGSRLPGAKCFEDYWGQLVPRHGPMRWLDFKQTASFRLTLADALPENIASTIPGSNASGMHHDCALPVKRQIIGRRRQLPTGCTEDELRDAFASGDGLNFVPLTDRPRPDFGTSARWTKDVADRPGLFVTQWPGAATRLNRKVDVACLGSNSDLLSVVLAGADTIVHEPMVPAKRLVLDRA